MEDEITVKSLSISAGKSILDAQVSDRERCIPYRPEYNMITGSIEASILLQQIYYWWVKKGREKFYKFNQPCESVHYREGDSWTEELGFTYNQFKSARNCIATKITKGVSKEEARRNSIVIYWTDSNRVTWYEVNESLLSRLINCAYKSDMLKDGYDPSKLLGNCEIHNYLGKCERWIYPNTETSQPENINKKTTKDSRAVCAGDSLNLNNKPEQNDKSEKSCSNDFDLPDCNTSDIADELQSKDNIQKELLALQIVENIHSYDEMKSMSEEERAAIRKEREDAFGVLHRFVGLDLPNDLVIPLATQKLGNPSLARYINNRIAKQQEINKKTKTFLEEMKDWLVPDLYKLGEAFYNSTHITPLPHERNLWVKTFSNFHKRGIEPIDIKRAVKYMNDRDWAILSPCSVEKTANSMMGKRDKDMLQQVYIN